MTIYICSRCGFEEDYDKSDVDLNDELSCPFCHDGIMKRWNNKETRRNR